MVIDLDKKTDSVQVKLNRIEGQVSGIKKMYDEERDCLEIVQQLVAVRSALTSVARDLLVSEASRCARRSKPEDFDKIITKLIEL